MTSGSQSVRRSPEMAAGRGRGAERKPAETRGARPGLGADNPAQEARRCSESQPQASSLQSQRPSFLVPPEQGRGRGWGQAGTCSGTQGCTRPVAPLEPGRGQPRPSQGPAGTQAAGLHLPGVAPRPGDPRELETERPAALRWPLSYPWRNIARRGKDEPSLLHPHSPKKSLYMVGTQ